MRPAVFQEEPPTEGEAEEGPKEEFDDDHLPSPIGRGETVIINESGYELGKEHGAIAPAQSPEYRRACPVGFVEELHDLVYYCVNTLQK